MMETHSTANTWRQWLGSWVSCLTAEEKVKLVHIETSGVTFPLFFNKTQAFVPLGILKQMLSKMTELRNTKIRTVAFDNSIKIGFI
jgi:hypothetical protein